MILNKFDLYFLCLIVIIIKMKQRNYKSNKLEIILTPVKFILTYNTNTKGLNFMRA